MTSSMTLFQLVVLRMMPAPCEFVAAFADRLHVPVNVEARAGVNATNRTRRKSLPGIETMKIRYCLLDIHGVTGPRDLPKNRH